MFNSIFGGNIWHKYTTALGNWRCDMLVLMLVLMMIFGAYHLFAIALESENLSFFATRV